MSDIEIANIEQQIRDENKEIWQKEQMRRKKISQKFSPKYVNTKIYFLRNKDDPTLIYVTSTNNIVTKNTSFIQVLDKEQRKQKKYYNKGYILGLSGYYHEYYMTLFDTVIEDYTRWNLELYKHYECSNEEQLNIIEKEIIRDFGTLNKIIHIKTKENILNSSGILPGDDYLL